MTVSLMASEIERLRAESDRLRRRCEVFQAIEQFRQRSTMDRPSPRFVDWRSGDRADQAPRPVYVASPLI